MNARDLDILVAESQAAVDDMFAEFWAEWLAQRAPMEQDAQQATEIGSSPQSGNTY